MSDRENIPEENENADTKSQEFSPTKSIKCKEVEPVQSPPTAVHENSLEINGNLPHGVQLNTKEQTENNEGADTFQEPASKKADIHEDAGSSQQPGLDTVRETQDLAKINKETTKSEIDPTTPSTNETRHSNEVDNISDVLDYVSTTEIENLVKKQRSVLPAKIECGIKNHFERHGIPLTDNNFLQGKPHDLYATDGITEHLPNGKLRYLSPGFEYVVGSGIFLDTEKSTFKETFCSDPSNRNCTTYIIKTTTSS